MTAHDHTQIIHMWTTRGLDTHDIAEILKLREAEVEERIYQHVVKTRVATNEIFQSNAADSLGARHT